MRLYELAKVLRSKNSGPYEITLDILFDDPEKYRRVVDSGCITRESVAQLYHLPPERILEFVRYDAALGIKSPICATCPPAPWATAMCTARSSTPR